MAHLASKTSIAAFARQGVFQATIETFEERFGSGREWHDVFCAFVTRSFGDKSAEELGDLCQREFISQSNSYHPFFFIILDERTNQDSSVLLFHQGDSAGNPAERQQLRASPESLASLITLLNVGMRDIPSILDNDGPENPEESPSWIYDVPLDFSSTQANVRMPITQFNVTTALGSNFRTLSLTADRVAAVDLPGLDIKLEWFGEPGPSVLLQSCWSKSNPSRKCITGQIV